jgi:hypothetical protein
MIQYPGDTPARLVAAVERLAADIARITAGEAPTPAEIEAAPLLDGWALALAPQTVLAGSVSSHPLLGTRPLIRTSPVYALDVERGWARTWSRFYQLGVSAQERAEGWKG